MGIERVNPDTLLVSPAFSQVVVTEGSGRTIYVGGQNGRTKDGGLVEGGVGAQTEQALRNVILALDAVHATPADVVRLGIYILAGEPIGEGFAAAQRIWVGPPSTITVLVVAGLASPGALVEVEATAFVGSA